MSKSRPSTTRAPMAGRAANRHGSCCGGPPGIDCSDYGGDAHWQRRVEAREWRRDQDDEDDEAPAGEAGA